MSHNRTSDNSPSFRIQTNDGLSVRFDLDDEEQAREYLAKLKDPDFREMVSTIAVIQQCSGKWRCPECKQSKRLICNGCRQKGRQAECAKQVQFVMARPEGFDQKFYHIERLEKDVVEGMHGGHRITCFVDDVRLTITTHANQPAARISLLKTGKQRYNPLAE